MKESRQLDFALADLRSVKDGDKVKAVGYAAVYDSESLPIDGGFVEIVKRSAFKTSMKGGEDIFAFVEHDNTKILGRRSNGTLRLVDDRRGLHVECDLPPTSYGKDLAVSIDRGDIRGMSFSFTTVTDSWESRGGRDIRSRTCSQRLRNVHADAH